LALRAARDEIREWITAPTGDQFELMRPRLLHRLSTAPGLAPNVKYAITGKVRDHRSMPAIVGTQLGVDAKVCGQFYFLRKIHNGDPMYVSPFTASAEQTTRLLDAAEAKQIITMIVRIEIREPTATKDFRGFVFFQKKKEKPKLWNWCFVVEQVLDGEISVQFGEQTSVLEKLVIAPTVKNRAKMPRSRPARVQVATE
jgi:hypothetical protein